MTITTQDTWLDNDFVASDGGHTNQGIWTYSGDPCSLWVEAGVTYGFDFTPGLFYYYMAHTSLGDVKFSPPGNPHGVTNTFRLEWIGDFGFNGSGIYRVWRDHIGGSELFLEIDGLGSGSCVSTAGLEIATDLFNVIDQRSYAATHNLSSLKYKEWGTWIWRDGWRHDHSWVDWPCGMVYNGSPLSRPKCLNGSYDDPATIWSNNKL